MTVKEQVVRESINRAETERKRLRDILDINPYSEIIKLERDAIEKAKAYHRERKTLMAMAVIKDAQLKKDALLMIARKQQDSLKMIERIVELDAQLSALHMELYHIEREKERRNTTIK